MEWIHTFFQFLRELGTEFAVRNHGIDVSRPSGRIAKRAISVWLGLLLWCSILVMQGKFAFAFLMPLISSMTVVEIFVIGARRDAQKFRPTMEGLLGSEAGWLAIWIAFVTAGSFMSCAAIAMGMYEAAVGFAQVPAFCFYAFAHWYYLPAIERTAFKMAAYFDGDVK